MIDSVNALYEEHSSSVYEDFRSSLFGMSPTKSTTLGLKDLYEGVREKEVRRLNMVDGCDAPPSSPVEEKYTTFKQKEMKGPRYTTKEKERDEGVYESLVDGIMESLKTTVIENVKEIFEEVRSLRAKIEEYESLVDEWKRYANELEWQVHDAQEELESYARKGCKTCKEKAETNRRLIEALSIAKKNACVASRTRSRVRENEVEIARQAGIASDWAKSC